MHIEGSRAGKSWVIGDTEHMQSQSGETYKEEIKSLQMEIESLKAKVNVTRTFPEGVQSEERVVEIHEDNASRPVDLTSSVSDVEDTTHQKSEDNKGRPEEVTLEPPLNYTTDNNSTFDVHERVYNNGSMQPTDNGIPVTNSNGQMSETAPEKMVNVHNNFF